MKHFFKRNFYYSLSCVIVCLLALNLMSCEDDNKQEVVYYTVDFDSTGGSAVESQSIKRFDQIVKPENPTKEEYSFAYWSQDAEGGQAYDFEKPVFKNMVLYAYWTPEFYMVTFDTQGGSSIDPVKVKALQAVEKPEDPTKENARFIEWSLDEQGSNPYDFSTPVEYDLTLYAQWGKATNTVIFDTDGGSTIESVEVAYNQTVSKPIDPTKEFNEFLGWYMGSSEFDFATPIQRDVTLTAKWKPIKVKDIEGNIYNVVEINGIFWMKENLKTATLNDGTTIKVAKSLAENDLSTSSTPACCSYDYTEANWTQYGYLYNKATIITNKICPKGWHIPSEAEWDSMVTFVGGADNAANRLRATTSWHSYSTNTTTDEYGLSLLGAGWLETTTFKYMSLLSGWWCGDADSSDPVGSYKYKSISYDHTNISTGKSKYAVSIRCIKD